MAVYAAMVDNMDRQIGRIMAALEARGLRVPEDVALEALWVLNLRSELDDGRLRKALQHPNEHVRRWAVRLFGDRNSVDASTLSKIERTLR